MFALLVLLVEISEVGLSEGCADDPSEKAVVFGDVNDFIAELLLGTVAENEPDLKVELIWRLEVVEPVLTGGKASDEDTDGVEKPTNVEAMIL